MFQALQPDGSVVRLQRLSKQDPDCCLDAVLGFPPGAGLRQLTLPAYVPGPATT